MGVRPGVGGWLVARLGIEGGVGLMQKRGSGSDQGRVGQDGCDTRI